jgi:tight adherence protein B
MGVNALGFLTGSALGWLSLVMAGVMVFAAERWSSAMVRDATPGPGYLSPACDLLAIATSGGASPEVAKARVEEALIRHELPEPEEGTLQRLTELSRRVGVPLRQLAKAEAEWSRAKARALAADKTAALSVKILVPLGSLVLPAFVLVAVVPVVFSLLEGAFAPGGSSLW